MAFENISDVVNPALADAGTNVAAPYTPAAPTAGTNALGQTVPASPTNAAQPYQPTTSFGKILSQSLAGTALDPAARQAAASQPLGWAKTLVGSAMQAASGIQAGIGDAAAVGKVPEGAGALYGIAKTMQAHNERIAAQKQQQAKEKQQEFENNEKQKMDQATLDEKHALIAQTNVQTRQEQLVASRLNAEYLDKQAADGREQLKTLTTPQNGAAPANVLLGSVNAPITAAQATQALKDNKVTGFENHAIPVGKVQNGEDDKGNPLYEQGYVAVGDLPPVTPTSGWISQYNLTHKGGAQFDSEHPPTIPGDQYLAASQEIRNVETATAAAKKAAIDADDADRAENIKAENNSFAKNGEWLNALAHNNNNPDKAADAILSNPAMRQKYPNLQQDIRNAQGYKDQKEWDEAKHQRVEEANKAEELKQKQTAAVTSNLTGDDYLQTLPTARRGMVQAVGEGRQFLPANRKEALALLEQVHQAYPDFDEHKIKDWQKATTEYGSGKTGQALVRANTAMAHAKALYDETTANAVLNPLSKEHQDREVTLGLLKDEIGAAVKGGVVTEGEGKELLGNLSGGLTVGAKKERIAEVTRRLHDRIEEQQTQYASLAPSSATKVRSLMSPQAADAYDYVQSGGKTQPVHQQAVQQPATNVAPKTSTPPSGHKNAVYGPDGKLLGTT